MGVRRAVSIGVCVALCVAGGVAPTRAEPRSAGADASTLSARDAARLWITSGGATRAGDDVLTRTTRRPPAATSGPCDQTPLIDARRDARPFDLVGTTLESDCGTFTVTSRMAKDIDLSRLSFWSVDLDIEARLPGCEGAEYMMLTFVEQRRPVGYVVETPSCDANTWVMWEKVPIERPDRRSLRVSFSSASLKSQGAYTPIFGFRWRSSIDATGTGGFDVVPDATWARFKTPLSAPERLEIFVSDSTSATLVWLTTRAPYTVTLSPGDTTVTIMGKRYRTARHTFTGLTPDTTYIATIVYESRGRTSQPSTIRFTTPAAEVPA